MDVISIIILIAMIIGFIVYIAMCIKESKQQESFYHLQSIIEKAENEKIAEELNKQLDKMLKEIKSITNDTNKTTKSTNVSQYEKNEQKN